jgi:hypothetical protein
MQDFMKYAFVESVGPKKLHYECIFISDVGGNRNMKFTF